MPYGDVKGYIPENDGFKMKMGSKEKFDNSSHFSMKDADLIQASPLVKNLVGDQHKLPTELKQAIMNAPETTPLNAIQSDGINAGLDSMRESKKAGDAAKDEGFESMDAGLGAIASEIDKVKEEKEKSSTDKIL